MHLHSAVMILTTKLKITFFQNRTGIKLTFSGNKQLLLLCDAMLAWYKPVSVRVRMPKVGVLSKRQNEFSWFLARELPSNYPTLCHKEIQVSQKWHCALELCPKFLTTKCQWWSLLTTFTGLVNIGIAGDGDIVLAILLQYHYQYR